MPIDYSQWQSCENNEEPRDQQRDLFGSYWAEVGPDGGREPDGWSWTILEYGNGGGVAGGYAADEAAAKRAVQDWADANKDGPSAPRYRWNIHSMPSGRGCRCSGMSVSERMHRGEVTGDRRCLHACPDSTTEEVPANENARI